MKLNLLLACLLVLSTPTKAATLLAGYEPSETILILSTPDNMTLTKVVGGINGIPAATEGNYVLRMDWMGDDNLKVEIKHQWTDCYTFDLAGYDEVLVDVYLASSTAEPNIVGIWDDVFGWIEGDPVPKSLNTWNTISYNVSGRTDVGLDHIYALVFEQLHGDIGTIYIDNLRIIPRRTISFSGYDWTVLQSDWEIGSGPCCYTAEENDIWVDPEGYLHMSIVYKDPNWYCSEVISNTSFGYGTYVYTVQGDINALDQNVIVGLFVYDVPDPNGNPREIDVELSRWGNPLNENAQYVVQPHSGPGNKERYNIAHTENRFTTTHVFIWTEDGIHFWSYYGDFTLCPDENDIISSWFCASTDIPLAGCEKTRINFYLSDGHPPSNGQNSEIVIKGFQYIPDTTPVIDLSDFAFFASHWLEENCDGCDGLDCTNDGNLNIHDLWCCIIPNWTIITPPEIFGEAQLVGSWAIDTETGDWAGFTSKTPELSDTLGFKSLSYEDKTEAIWGPPGCHISYYSTWSSCYYICSCDRMGNDAGHLYKIDIPIETIDPNQIDYIEVNLKRKPANLVNELQSRVGKYLNFMSVYCNDELCPPDYYPPDIPAIVKVDYSFNSPVGSLSPEGEHNLFYEEIGGYLHHDYFEDPYYGSVGKSTISFLPSDRVVGRIFLDGTVNTVWISVYPDNIQSMKSQIEPYAADALDDPDMLSYQWGFSVGATYEVKSIYFHVRK